jgi:hypothetical protein
MKISNILILIWIMVAIVGTVSYALPSQASGSLEISYPGKPGPLFHEMNMAPKESVTKQITVKNNTKNTQKLSLNLKKLVGTPDKKLAKVLTLKITRGGDVLFEKPISNIDGDDIYLEKIPAGKTYTYDFKVTMKNVGNEYQGKQIKFDMNLNAQEQQVAGDRDHHNWWDDCNKHISDCFR